MRSGFQRIAGGSTLPRHRHRQAHATVVLSGAYTEAGDLGRWTVEPGHVLIHHPFTAHFNRIAGSGAEVLNLILAKAPNYCAAHCEDPDLVARIARRDPNGAAEALASLTCPRAGRFEDWLDRLAQAMRSQATLSISSWAQNQGVSASRVSRAFLEAFGVSPKRYRAETRALSAWRRIVETDAPLAQIAMDLGFADQPHMTRAIVEITGASPARWRPRQR